MVRDDIDPISHLQLCLDYQRHWCEHKPSVTISVHESEWESVGKWVFAHFEELAGVSFLPFDTGTYQQTPYETIEEAEFNSLSSKMPESIDWAAFQAVERGWRDFKVGGDLACSTGECEAVGDPVDTATVASGGQQ
jgi:ribonucleoside-triphosphate reductase (thioredoxin)